MEGFSGSLNYIHYTDYPRKFFLKKTVVFYRSTAVSFEKPRLTAVFYTAFNKTAVFYMAVIGGFKNRAGVGNLFLQ
jgi:hypothetical protein